jgi:hypothetical protein
MARDVPWSEYQLIPGVPPNSREPALVAVGQTLHLVYTNNRILFHTWWQEHTWTTPTRVAAGERASLAATADNQLHCLFSNQFVGNYEIYYTFWDGVTWSLPQNVSHTRGASTRPVITVAPDGKPHAAWADTTPGYSVIYHATREEPFWSNAPLPNGRGCFPAIAAMPNGDIYIAWQDRRPDTSRYDVFCSILHDEAWSIPDIVSDCPSGHSIQPRLATSTSGGCHIIWQEEEEGIYRVRHADYRPGGWSIPTTVSTTGADCRLPNIVASHQGYLQALWLEGQYLIHRVRSTAYDALWLEPEVASDRCAGVTDFAMAITPTGQLHVVLCGLNEDGTRRLYHIQRQPVLRHTAFIPIA